MDPYLDEADDRSAARHAFPWRRALWFALLGLIVLWLVIRMPDFSQRAELGTAYGAQMGCACRYIQGRDIESCAGDLEDAAWMVSIKVDEDSRSVTGSAPLFGSSTARFRPDRGCQLQADD